MSSTSATTTPSISRTSTGALWRTGLLAGLAGGIAALAVGTIGLALDVPMVVSQPGGTVGEVPLPAFIISTMVATVIGIALALLLRQRAARPARTFVIVTVVATALSLIQPVIAAPDMATAVVLDLSHLAAAAVIIPLLARALPARR